VKASVVVSVVGRSFKETKLISLFFEQWLLLGGTADVVEDVLVVFVFLTLWFLVSLFKRVVLLIYSNVVKPL